MDTEAVIANARGDIDEALLTSTGGGLLGRKVLADEPLVAHLEDGERLQYLLAGAAAPTRTDDGHRKELETEGSYRTLLAVTDRRLVLVAGSADGDRVVEFGYPALAAVDARRGLLTDEVVLEEAAGPTWEVTVRSGSDVGAAARYAAERAEEAGSRDAMTPDRQPEDPRREAAADAPDGGGADAAGGPSLDVTAGETAPDGSATIDSFLQDATVSEADEPARQGDVGTPDATSDDQVTDGGDGGVESDATGSGMAGTTGETASSAVDRLGAGGATESSSSDGTGQGRHAGEDQSESDSEGARPADGATRPEDQSGGTLAGGAPRAAQKAAPETDPVAPDSDLARALFSAVIDEASMPAVEGYASGDVERVVSDVEAHLQRVRDQLAAGELEAARGAAATVATIAREGERVASDRGAAEARQRIAELRGTTRGLLLDAALDVEDLAVLEGPEPAALERLLQGVDPTAFEHLVADLWSELGYQTAVTQSSKDKGVDVVARQSTPVEQTVVIQAKRYGPDTKVGREAVQQYASLHRQEPDADLVVVVTTGEVTGPAREASADLDVKLVDGERLVEILLERDLYDLVARYA